MVDRTANICFSDILPKIKFEYSLNNMFLLSSYSDAPKMQKRTSSQSVAFSTQILL
jgi:hypothetical protein